MDVKRRHPDGFACQQGGYREGQGFPGRPSQSPSDPSPKILFLCPVLSGSTIDGAQPRIGSVPSDANAWSLEKYVTHERAPLEEESK